MKSQMMTARTDVSLVDEDAMDEEEEDEDDD